MAVAEDFTIEEKEEQERMVLESVDRFLERDVEPFSYKRNKIQYKNLPYFLSGLLVTTSSIKPF